ncbi:MAG: hypothetical protein RID91_00810 [Azospirillaceae bacterium]
MIGPVLRPLPSLPVPVRHGTAVVPAAPPRTAGEGSSQQAPVKREIGPVPAPDGGRVPAGPSSGLGAVIGLPAVIAVSDHARAAHAYRRSAELGPPPPPLVDASV